MRNQEERGLSLGCSILPYRAVIAKNRKTAIFRHPFVSLESDNLALMCDLV